MSISSSNADDSVVLAAYHQALIDGSAIEVGDDNTSSLEGMMQCLRMMERNRQLDQSTDSVTDSNTPQEQKGWGQLVESVPSFDNEIGRFQVIRKLGQGGNGVVFLAKDPKLDREIALKLPKPAALLSSEYIQRFEREARIAANLCHPHIVSVFETGAIGPISYIASEFCDGPTLSEWLGENEKPMSPRAAANLIRVLAEATHHAHSRGVLHRDIKPSNVLIERIGEQSVVADALHKTARLTDFGLAKQVRNDDVTITGAASILGTPAYMAPEQADGKVTEIGTHTDVFALGCILHELLKGEAPFRRESQLATLQAVRMDTLKSLSTHVTVPRDLEAITLKCLEKRCSDRYSSADALASDLAAYLDGKPVTARRISKYQKLWRWMRANPAVSSLAFTVSLLVLTVAVVSTVAAVRLAKARRQIEQEAANLQAVSDFLGSEIFGQASPYLNPNRNMSLLNSLDHASRRLDGYFSERPIVEAKVRSTLGKTYFELARYELARKHLMLTHKIYDEHLGPQNEKTLKSRFRCALLEFKDGDQAFAAREFEQTLVAQKQQLGAKHPDTLITASWFAYCLAVQQEFEQASNLFESTNRSYAETYTKEYPDALNCLDLMARMFRFQERYEEAEALHEELLSIRRRVLGEIHPDYLDSLSDLANVKLLMGDSEAAADLYQQVVPLQNRVLGNDHPTTLDVSGDAANAMRKVFEFELAEKYFQETLVGERKRFGNDDPRTLASLRSLGSLYRDRGRYDDAANLFENELLTLTGKWGEDDDRTTNVKSRLARVYISQRRFDKAIVLLSEVLQAKSFQYSAKDSQLSEATLDLALALKESHQFREAEQLLEKQLATQKEQFGVHDAKTLRTMMRLAQTKDACMELSGAIKLFREVWEVGALVWSPDHPTRLACGSMLGRTLRRRRKFDEAALVLEEALEARRRHYGSNHINVSYSLRELGHLHAAKRDFKRSEAYYRECATIRLTLQEISHEELGTAILDWNSVAKRSKAKEATEFRQTLVENLSSTWSGFDAQEPVRSVATLTMMLSVSPKTGRGMLSEECRSLLVEFAQGVTDAEELAHLRRLVLSVRKANLPELREDLIRTLLAQQEKRLGRSHYEVQKTVFTLAQLLSERGRVPEADALFLELLETLKGFIHADDGMTGTKGAELAMQRSDVTSSLDEDASLFFQRLAEFYRSKPHRKQQDLRVAMSWLQSISFYMGNHGNLEVGLECQRLKYELHRQLDGEFHLGTANALGRIAWFYEKIGEWPKACETRILELKIRQSSEVQSQPPLACELFLCRALLETGELSEAERIVRRNIEMWDDRPNDVRGLEAYRVLGIALAKQGRFDDAIATMKQAMESDLAHQYAGAQKYLSDDRAVVSAPWGESLEETAAYVRQLKFQSLRTELKVEEKSSTSESSPQ